MKVLQMLPELNYGGVEVGAVDMARQMLLMGHQPYVMSAGGKLVEVLHKMGVPHIALPINRKSLKTLSLIREVAEFIRRERIDIVHARSRVPAWVGFLATRATDATFITSCHGYYSKQFFSNVMGYGKRVIVISHMVGRHMIDNFNVDPDRVRLVHRGLDLDLYSCDMTRFADSRKKQKEKFVIANIARITPLKGHLYFLQALRLAKRKFPMIEVWLIGGAGDKQRYFEEVVDLIDKLGLKDSVKIMGSRNDIPQLLKEVDLLVLSTTVPEGFGRVLIEAGAAGVPVIATRVGGVLDVITHGREGFLVSPNDPVEMSERIIDVINHYGQCKEVAERFRAKIEDQFTLKRMAQETVAVYKEAVQSKSILVFKLGALGDVILAVPSLRALRKKYPQAHIAVVVDQKLAPVIEHCPYINEVITVQRNEKKRCVSRSINLVKRLRAREFDISIDFQNNRWTHGIAYAAGVRKRFGYKRGLFGWMLSNGIRATKDKISPIKHQERVLNLMGIADIDENLELWTTPDDDNAVSRMIAGLWTQPKDIIVGFVLNASLEWQTKRWPLEYFIELAGRLAREFKAGIILIGDAASKSFAEQFLLKTDTDAVDLTGKTSLREMIAVIKQMSCLVCGDTAPLHVATAVKTRAVALFGPTDPNRHVVPSGETVILRKNLSCSPCYKRHCSHTQCMSHISVEEVFQSVKAHIIAKHGAAVTEATNGAGQ